MNQLSKEQLLKLRECYANAHDVLSIGTFPGLMSNKIYESICFLKANVTDLDAQIKKLEEAEPKPEFTPDKGT